MQTANRPRVLATVAGVLCVLALAFGFVQYQSAAYAAPAEEPEFYAVFNTSAEGGKVANTLSFYYDSNKASHSASSETVYDNLPTAATKKNNWQYNDIRENVNNVVIDASVANYHGLTSTTYMFADMKNANNISGCEYLDVSNVTNMQNMFYQYAASSTNITAVPDVSKWKTGNVINMAGLFGSYAASSTSITAVPDVSDWKTGNVTSMQNMFYQYASNSTAKLQALDLSKWSISSLTDTKSMFRYYAAKNTQGEPVVYATDWSTTKATGVDAQFMFNDSKLKGFIQGNWASANTSDTGCFTVKSYTVTFDMQGHGTQVDPQTVEQGAKADKPDNPSATGYTFGGWYKEDACTNAWIFGTDTVTDDTTLYAQWTAKTTSVTLDASGGTAGSKTSVTATYDDAMPALTATGNLPTKTGYTFTGFFDAQTSGTKYYNADGTSAKKWNKENSTLTLYAQWTPISYDITYVENDGTWEQGYEAPIAYTIEDEITLPTNTTISKTCYTFAGWYDNSGFVGSAITKIESGTTGDKTYYAKWTPYAYTITFDKNAQDATSTMSDMDMTYDEAANLTANAFAREGYMFAGWNTQSDGKGTAYADKASVKNLSATQGATVTLYAQWMVLPVVIVPTDGSVKVTEEAKTAIEKAQAEAAKYYEALGATDVKISFKVEVAQETETDDVAIIVQNIGTNKYAAYSVSLTVGYIDDQGAQVTGADYGSINDVIVPITYSFDFNKKADVKTYRVHNGVVSELTETANKDGEFVKYDTDAGTITVAAKKYSTYAFVYSEVSSVPETGDATSFALMGLMALIAAAGAITLVARKRVER